MSQMLAPARLLELIRDPRIMAAAVANATTALTKGLSAANQEFVFMLIISSFRRSTFHRMNVKFLSACGVAVASLDSAPCDHGLLVITIQ